MSGEILHVNCKGFAALEGNLLSNCSCYLFLSNLKVVKAIPPNIFKELKLSW